VDDRVPGRAPLLPAVGAAAGVAATVLAAWLGSFRLAGAVLALTLAAAAVARTVLPPGRAGTLAVRSRGVDVATLVVLATGIGLLARYAPG
jgi:hypothetical protein